MKKIFLLAFTYLSASFNAQFTTGTATDPRFNTNTFLDVSENTVNFDNNTNKGLNFPQVDLRTFKLDVSMTDGITYPTYYDGMVVYNIASGTTSGNTLTTQTTITPGFYYFYNPNGATSGNITSGVWRPMTVAASNSKVDVKTTETVTNTLIDTKQVYAIKGMFTADGVRTDVDILSPAGMTSLYGITIYQSGTKKVYARDLYEYNISTTATTPTKNAITGSPRISIVYPAGNYEYVLEYLK